jgi:hypothetical protein
MRNILSFILSAFAVFSCNDKDAAAIESQNVLASGSCSATLTLVQSVSSWLAGDVAPANTPMYQEIIVLSADSNFIKTRTFEGKTSQEQGTYTFTTHDNRQYVVLAYENPQSMLRTSCTLDGEEIQIISTTQAENTSWMACDGPTQVYDVTTTCPTND